MTDVIEKVAKAFCWQEHKGRTGMDSPEESWAHWHSSYETLAEAAIAALADGDLDTGAFEQALNSIVGSYDMDIGPDIEVAIHSYLTALKESV